VLVVRANSMVVAALVQPLVDRNPTDMTSVVDAAVKVEVVVAAAVTRTDRQSAAAPTFGCLAALAVEEGESRAKITARIRRAHLQ
jgi:hypothetical protein